MVSLLQLAEIDENGVNFKSPFDESNCLLTPEHSIEIQNVIGAGMTTIETAYYISVCSKRNQILQIL